MLEHDAYGERYADPRQVREAIAEYESIRKDLDAKNFDINLVVAYARAGEYKKAAAFARELPAGAQRDALLIAAIAASDGAPAAIKEAGRFADAEPRRQAIQTAGDTLVLLREYPAASQLLAEAARGAAKPGALLTQADAVKRLRRSEDMPMPPDDPTSVLRRFLVLAHEAGPSSARA